MARSIDLQHALLLTADASGLLGRLVRARFGWLFGFGVEAMARDLAELGTLVADLLPRLDGAPELAALARSLDQALLELPRGIGSTGVLGGWLAFFQSGRLVDALEASIDLEGALRTRLDALDPSLAEVLEPDDGAAGRGRPRSSRLSTARVTAAG